MRLSAIIDTETHALEVRDGEGVYTVEIGGETHEVDARPMEGSTWSLIIDGESYEVDVVPEPEGDGLTVRLRGHEYHMEILDERRMRMREATRGFEVEGRAVVRSPMPGKVVKLLVRVGDEVAEGDGLVVVEAMKMENELRAPKAGTVVELPAQEGQLVEGNALLVVIE